VRRIGADGHRYIVDADRIDETGNVVEARTFVGDALFLAAGSLGTTGLLVRARAEASLANLDEHIGTGWGSNGDAMFLRTMVGASTGMQQGLPPAVALLREEGPYGPVLVEHAPYPSGADCECLLALGMGLSRGRGEMRWDDASGRAVVRFPEDGNDDAVQAVGDLAQTLVATNGGKLSSSFREGESVTRSFTYHPLGGAPMGTACDLFGRVRGHHGLYVVDGALMPGSGACANPSFTIAAIAERCLDTIIADDFA
jgi:cholesterol oxidase